MRTICIAQGGRFLLGIDAEDILARRAWSEAKPGGKIVQLSALLSQQPGGAVPSDAICLELQGEDETFFLLIDRIVDEAEVINPPGPLPPACPPLAARLCPQVTIWGDTPVLLLDPAQVMPVAAELGEGIGLLITEKEIVPELPEEELPAFLEEPALTSTSSEEPLAFFDEEPDKPAAETEQAVVEDSAAEDEAIDFFAEPDGAEEEQDDPFFPVIEKTAPLFTKAQPEEMAELEEPTEPVAAISEDLVVATETGPGVCFRDANADEPERPPTESQKKESSTIDEETFKKVMTWTIARFKQSRAGQELHLSTEQLPSELAGMMEQKGLNRNIIQYLIDQIVLRCKESAGRNVPGEKHVG